MSALTHAPKTHRLTKQQAALLTYTRAVVNLSPKEQDTRDYLHGADTPTDFFRKGAAIRRCAAYQYLQG